MKVAIVTWALSPPFGLGGIARYVHSLATNLVEAGCEVVVFYAKGHTEGQSDERYESVRIKTSRWPLLRLFQFSRRLQQEIEGGSFDVVHVHIPQLGWGLSGNVPIVVTVHTTARGEGRGIANGRPSSCSEFVQFVVFCTLGRAMEAATISHATSIVTVNEAVANEVVSDNRVPRMQVEIVEPAVNPSGLRKYSRQRARIELGLEMSDFIVLFVGRLSTRKNPLALLDGFSAALARTRRSLKLVYCGDGELRSRLLERIHEMSVDDRVTVMGLVDETQLSIAYSAADLYVLPSLMEGYPATLVECRLFGLPALVGNFPGVERVIGQFNSGMVIKNVRPETIADAIVRLSEDSSALERLAINAAHSSQYSTTWKEITDSMLSIYRHATSYQRFKRS